MMLNITFTRFKFRRWCVLKANVLYRLATPSSDDVIDKFKLDVWAVKRWDSGSLHGRPFCCELIYDVSICKCKCKSQFIAKYHSSTYKDFILLWCNTATTSRHQRRQYVLGFVTAFSRSRVRHSTAEPLHLHLTKGRDFTIAYTCTIIQLVDI